MPASMVVVRLPNLSMELIVPRISVSLSVGMAVETVTHESEGTGGPGVSKAWRQIGIEYDATVMRICPEDIRGGALSPFDVVTFTGGSGSGLAQALGAEGREAVRAFVKEGGGYVGVCAGAFLALGGYAWSLGILDGKPVSPKWRRGKGSVAWKPTRTGRRVLELPEAAEQVAYHNGPIFEPGRARDVPDYHVWVRFKSEIAENGTPRGVMVDAPAIAAGRYGKGRVVVISPHPEQTRGLENVLPRSALWAAGRTR